MVRRIKLSPVRENESENHRARWKRKSQVLGSVLHWAHDAGAISVEFNSTTEGPFTYVTSQGNSVRTELGDPPSEFVDTLAQLIRDTIDGHPWVRPFRRLYRKLTKTQVSAEIEIPPTNTYSGSTWSCMMNGDNATFDKLSTTGPIANGD